MIHKLHFDIDGEDFGVAGLASSNFKKVLKQLGISPEIIRSAAICMYEGEINTIIHGKGGTCDVAISEEDITIVFSDTGPGIANIEQAMKEGFSTATDHIRDLGFGAGMGLPNMKKNTDSMEIQTELGKGTTIKMIINL